MQSLKNHECLDLSDVSIKHQGLRVIEGWAQHKRSGYPGLGYGKNILDLTSSPDIEFLFDDNQVRDIDHAIIEFGETDDKVAVRALGLKYVSRLPMNVVVDKLGAGKTRVRDGLNNIQYMLGGRFGGWV